MSDGNIRAEPTVVGALGIDSDWCGGGTRWVAKKAHGEHRRLLDAAGQSHDVGLGFVRALGSKLGE